MRVNIKTWHQTWMAISHEIKQRSKDTTKIGATLVDWTGKKQLATAYNGPPKFISDDIDWSNRDLKNSLICHAESNCLWFAAESHGIKAMEMGTMYCTGKPCSSCTLQCVRAKLCRIVYDTDLPRMVDETEWKKSVDIASRGWLDLVPFSNVENDNERF